MAVGRSKAKASELTGHTACRLGKWYYDTQTNSQFKDMPAFKAIEAPHKIVHDHGIEAAKCFEHHDIDAGMRHYKMLDDASKKVVEGLKSLLRP